jgi:hypothetical protein
VVVTVGAVVVIVSASRMRTDLLSYSRLRRDDGRRFDFRVLFAYSRGSM